MSGKRASSRPRERDYSHLSLLDKLGIKAGQSVAILGLEDSSFLNEIRSRVPQFTRDAVAPGLDLIFFGASSRSDLPRLKLLARAIHKAGAIWAVHPKGQTHIRGVDVIAAGKTTGLVDNKVCRFSKTHTALRFVIPLARR
jgi:hypothetical protein